MMTVVAGAVMLVAAPAVHACGYHDPSGYQVGMLNWAYPDALHVRTAVWMAQRDGLLDPAPSLPAVDPMSPQARLRQMTQLRETQARLDAVHVALDAAAVGRPLPAFAVVLIGPMLWSRFETADEGVRMASHIQGPAPDDVVLVTDAPVLASLVEGRITLHSARDHGLARLYGSPGAVERVWAMLDHAAHKLPALRAHRIDPVQEN